MPIYSTKLPFTAANLPPTWSLAASTSVTSVDNNSPSVTMRSEATNVVPGNHHTALIRVGMKREASIASGIVENGLDMHKWLPTKKANISTSSSLDGVSQNKESIISCNGDDKLESSFQNCDSKSFSSESGTSFPTIFTCGPVNPGFIPINSCTEVGGPHATAEVTTILNPLNMSIYGLPFSSQPTASIYAPSQFLYSPLYSMNNSCDASTSMASTAAALALNNFLIQQQQQIPSHQLLRTQLPTVSNPQLSGPGLYSSYVPSTLATAAALAATQQSPSPDIHANNANFAFQQQQQALLLSLLLRSQQVQLAAAQVAAAGYLSQNDASRLPPIPTLQNPGCVLDSSCSLGTSLTSGPYGTNNFYSQNPMTNVAYINEKGHLLETLPICRDFKAGKCRRNSECRYVHLVDENVEVNQGRVIVCRDAAKGRCTRVPCKYYHIPLFAISANRSMALNSALANATGFSTISTL
ncbi:unnamed protein product [Heterobilharzia americana]|nr:unnamed protein product [Heterobilharzia americana]